MGIVSSWPENDHLLHKGKYHSIADSCFTGLDSNKQVKYVVNYVINITS